MSPELIGRKLLRLTDIEYSPGSERLEICLTFEASSAEMIIDLTLAENAMGNANRVVQILGDFTGPVSLDTKTFLSKMMHSKTRGLREYSCESGWGFDGAIYTLRMTFQGGSLNHLMEHLCEWAMNMVQP